MKIWLKVLIALVSAIALVAISVLGTIAYFTSQAEVTNVFTVGKITITLDESKTDEWGNPVQPEERVTTNTYTLIPGHTYTKDPVVTIVKGSEAAYVRAIVIVNNKAVMENKFEFVNASTNENWELMQSTAIAAGEGELVFEFRYRTDSGSEIIPRNANSDTKLRAVFDNFRSSGLLTSEMVELLEDLKIDVVAHAIQSDGFTSEEEAWTAFDAQMN